MGRVPNVPSERRAPADVRRGPPLEGEDEEGDISAALESLRSRGVKAQAGGKLRKAASTAVLQTTSNCARRGP